MAELTISSLPKGFVDPHISLAERNAVPAPRALRAAER
jgi:hypothetical protein